MPWPACAAGASYGRVRHDAGRPGDKQPVLDDLCDCARFLVGWGWTRPGRIAIHGGSDGGLLVGACPTEHPGCSALQRPTSVPDCCASTSSRSAVTGRATAAMPTTPDQYRCCGPTRRCRARVGQARRQAIAEQSDMLTFLELARGGAGSGGGRSSTGASRADDPRREKTMRTNDVKRRLAEGGVALGSFVFEMATPGLARMATVAGADFVIFDMEHTGWGYETIAACVSATTTHGAAPFVRVPVAERSQIGRVLDTGAMGVMVPMVPDGRRAEDIVRWSRYPPEGVRGAAFGLRRDGFIVGEVTATMASANEETLVIAQIETEAGLRTVEEIAAVDGVDVLWVGQSDLTNSLGIPGQFRHRAYLDALERVAAAATAHHKVAGFMAPSVEEAEAMLSLGYRCLAIADDVTLYVRALRDALQQVRSRVAAAPLGGETR
jgi:2-keto-3-deoxy-L-rhamnonate aldolase RhmA